jgi:hypothetical protein
VIFSLKALIKRGDYATTSARHRTTTAGTNSPQSGYNRSLECLGSRGPRGTARNSGLSDTES